MSLKWKLDLVCLERVLTLMQDRCPVYAKCSTGSEIDLDAPDGTPRLHWSFGISFWSILQTVLVSVQDRCRVCAKLTIGSEIILDTPNGTPR
jgi:hypothetical protein